MKQQTTYQNLVKLFIVLLVFTFHNSYGQLTLTTSPYTQNFNTINTALPTGWTVRTGAGNTVLGASASLNIAQIQWSTATGQFANYASANSPSASADLQVTQNTRTDRALGLRQTSTVGDNGAAFVLQITNTTNLVNFSLSFKLMELDPTATAGRTATWNVDYGFGATPTAFTNATTVPATITTFLGSDWGTTNVTVNFGTVLNNNAGPVWIRIVTKSATTGSGSRPVTAIDDYNLSWSQVPAVQDHDITFSAISTDSMHVAWTNGDGTSRIVKINTANSFTNPANGTNPSANNVYSGSGEQVVYNSTGNSFNIKGLSPLTTYFFRVYNYNGAGVTTVYDTASAVLNPNSQATNSATVPTISLSSPALTAFVTTAGTPSASQTYTVTGSNLTDSIYIFPPALFEISLNGTTWINSSSHIGLAQSGGNVITTPVQVRYNPLVTGTTTGNISDTSTNATPKLKSVYGVAKAVEPTVQSAITFGVITPTSIAVNFSGGNGTRRILVARQTSAVTFVPTDTIPPAGINSIFTSATDQGSGNKIVYDGTGNTDTVTGLTASTVYQFAVYEYNGTGVTINYLTISPGTGSQSTAVLEPTTSASSVTFGCNGADTISMTFTGGNGQRRIVVMSGGSAVSFTPADFIAPTGVNSNFSLAADQGSGNKIVFDGTTTSAVVTGLTPGTIYFVKVFEYNGTGSSVNYLTSSFGSGSKTNPGPVSYSTTGSTYSQDFNTLPAATGAVPFVGAGPFYLSGSPICSFALNGWQIAKTSGTGANLIFNGDNLGNSTTGSLYSYGSSSGSTDRALGSLAAASVIGGLGVVLKNNTPDILSRVTVTYTGEEWKRGTGAANSLYFSYLVNGTNLTTGGTFTALPALNFQAPTDTGSNVALNGNAANNRTAISLTFDLNANWLPGQNLVLRWDDTNDNLSDDGLAIDDFSFVAVPPAKPTAQDSTITFSGVSTVMITTNWLNGNGASRIVKINKTNSFSNPVDGNVYAATSLYVGSGEQVVYNGSGTSVTVTGLSADSTYFFRVFGYNGTGGATKYNTVTAFNNPKSKATNPPSAATQLAIISVNDSVAPSFPTNIVAGKPFHVVVRSQDGSGNPQNVGTNTTVDLSVFSGLYNLVGIPSGVIQTGADTVTIYGVIYDTPDLGVQLNASASSGDVLTAGQSVSFDVSDSASLLVFAGVPASAIVDSLLNTFTVRALRVDSTLDFNYSGTITLTKISGPGNLLGTTIKSAIGGIATFNNINFDMVGTYVIRADAPGLNGIISHTIIITNIPIMTELVVPKYIGSKTGTTTNVARTPIAICVRLDNLAPNTLYDIKAAIELTSAAVTSYGAGNIGTPTNSFNGSTQTLPGAFTTNASGSSGPYWIIIQPTGGAALQFDAGQLHHLRLGFVASGGTMPSSPNFIGTKTIQALDISSIARTVTTADDGAFLKGSSAPCVAGKYILVYDSIAPAGDPLFSYQSRPAIDTNATQTDLPTAINDVYRQAGTSASGDYPAVIPIGANNPNGVRRIEARNADNSVFNFATDADGVWPSGANTTTITRRSVATLTLSDAGMNSVSISSITSTPVTCSNDGTATVTATGSGSLSYLWSNGATTASISSLASGSYTVTVNDSKGCSANTSVTVSQPASSTITASGSTTFCNGDSVKLSVPAGADHYAWSTNPSSDTLSSVVVKTSGSYTVVVTTASCPHTSLPITVTVNNFAINGTIFFENMGDIAVGSTTKVNNYTGWHNGVPAIFSSTPNVDTAQTDVRTSTPSNYANASGGNNIFFGTANSITDRNFNISGINTTGYAGVSLSFGLIRSAIGLSNDSMKVEVSTDGIGYSTIGNYATASTANWSQFTVSSGIPVTANLRIRFSKNNGSQFRIDDVLVTGLTNSVSILPTGPTTICGAGSVSLVSSVLTGNLWSPTNQTTQTITATSAVPSTTIYTVTITDANGCKATSAPVKVRFVPVVTVTIPSTTPASCSGGSATALAANGTVPFTYSWNSSPVQTTATATGLATGSYTVTVTDSNSCTASASTTIGLPAIATITAGGPTTFCNGDSVTLSAGAGASHYSWSSNPSVDTLRSIVVKTSGTYTVTANNGLGCIQTSFPVTVTVNNFAMNGTIFSESVGIGTASSISAYTGWQNSVAPIVFSSTSTSQSDVRTTTNSSGYTGASGNSNVFMGFSTGSPDRNFIISGINTLGYSGMRLTFGLKRDAGTDSVKVEVSADGSTYTQLAITHPSNNTTWILDTAVGSIPATANLRIRFSKNSTTGQFRIDDVKLTGITSTVNIVASGPTIICGTGGVRLTSNILNGNTWSPTNETTKSILAITSGTYTVTSGGSTGCPATSAPVVVQINPNPTVSITSITNASCFGTSDGSATALAAGGTGSLNYSWNTSPVQPTATASNLTAGTYTVTVTDANSCIAKDSSTTITQPSAITVTAVTSDTVICQGATVSLSSTGTTSTNLTFTNSTPVAIPDSSVANGIVPVTSSIVVSGVNSTSLTSGQIASVKINSLTHTYDGDLIIRLIAPDGRYLTLSNRRGFGANFTNTVFSSSATVALTSSPFTGTFKPDTSATASAAFASFNGVNPNGTWKLYVSDNARVDSGFINSWSITFNNPIAFAWTSSPTGFTSSAKSPGSVTPSSVGLGNVIYTVVATNLTTGCNSPSSSVTVKVIPGPSALASSTDVSCHNDSNGTVSVIASGGTTPYTYSWNTSPVQLTPTVTGLKAGHYTVTITDSNGCKTKADTAVANPAVITVSASAGSITCFGGTTNVVVSAVGGSGIYSSGTGTFSNVTAGTHTYTVTDNKGCIGSVTISIGQPSRIIVTATQGVITCNGGTTSVVVTATGGSGPYTSGTGTFTGVTAGIHTYTVFDSTGCSGSVTDTITEPAPIVINAFFPHGCNGDIISITGSNFTGATNVLFNGMSAAGFTIANDGEIDAAVPAGATSGFITVVKGTCSVTSTTSFTVNCVTNTTVTVKAFIQNYTDTTNMVMYPVMMNERVVGATSNQTDTVTIELHGHDFPNGLIESFTGVMDTAGTIACTFSSAVIDSSYYIVFKHRNSIETWSALPALLTAAPSVYDFSTSAATAFGGNLKLVSSLNAWLVYNGDVNQDGLCDGTDFNVIEPDVLAIAQGYYATDVNGDGLVDGSDFNSVEPNVLLIVHVIRP